MHSYKVLCQFRVVSIFQKPWFGQITSLEWFSVMTKTSHWHGTMADYSDAEKSASSLVGSYNIAWLKSVELLTPIASVSSSEKAEAAAIFPRTMRSFTHVYVIDAVVKIEARQIEMHRVLWTKVLRVMPCGPIGQVLSQLPN